MNDRPQPPPHDRPSEGPAAPGASPLQGAQATPDVDVTVREVLGRIAPEADLGAVAADADLREALDIDSFDFLNFVVGLHERLGLDIPEPDYPRLRTLAGCRAYLTARLAAKA